jgi:hypothetical protein
MGITRVPSAVQQPHPIIRHGCVVHTAMRPYELAQHPIARLACKPGSCLAIPVMKDLLEWLVENWGFLIPMSKQGYQVPFNIRYHIKVCF